MSTKSVPGAVAANRDELAMGAWAEHADGSMIFVESVEAGTVVYSIFDVSREPKVEYRDGMAEKGFKERFSWKPGDDAADQWTWHDKTPFPWQRVMGSFPSGPKPVSAVATISAAQRVADSLNLHAEAVRDRMVEQGTTAQSQGRRPILVRILDAVDQLRK